MVLGVFGFKKTKGYSATMRAVLGGKKSAELGWKTWSGIEGKILGTVGIFFESIRRTAGRG